MFSALGLLTADLFHDYSRPVLSETSMIDVSRVEEYFIEMEREGEKTLENEGVSVDRHRFKRTLDMRYKGQGFELNIKTIKPFDGNSVQSAVKSFHAKHKEVYGYAEKKEPVEIVNAKLRVIGLLDSPQLVGKKIGGKSEPKKTRRVYFETINDWIEVGVYDRNGLSSKVMGPAVIEQYDSTSVIYPGWSFEPDTYGNLLLRRTVK
jgi:N-methylhydantoinase A